MHGVEKTMVGDSCDGNIYARSYGVSTGLHLQLHCKADLFVHAFVAFGVCVQNGDVCATCKHEILFQT
jgi:hypothetical protein